MSLKPVLGQVHLAPTQKGAGTFATGPVSNPGAANVVLVILHVTAAEGDTHTLDAVIQTAPDASTWSTVSTATQITATTGQQVVAAYVGTDEYAQVVATVGGTNTPKVTYSLTVLVL